MKFSYNWLQSFFPVHRSLSEGGDKKIPTPEKLADFLMMHAFEVEDIYPVKSSKAGAKQFNRVKKGNDWILDLDILPNRMPDCASHIGIAREISAILNYKLKPKTYKIKEEKNKKVGDYLKVKVEDKKLCPRYCARVIEGAKIQKSPSWLKEKLVACGLQSINNVVDATNYIMLETGQPLHAFDLKKLKNNIIVRRAKTGEKITTLEDKKYALDKDVLVIADEKQPIAIAGIKGGKTAEIDQKTKTIVIESANFERTSVYKTSKKLKLQTDASVRFSAGLDPNLAEEAIDKVAALIQQLAGGKIAKGIVDVYPQKVNPITIKLSFDYVKSLLGIEFSKKEIISILNSLGLKVKSASEKTLTVVIPTFRRDLSIQEDLIEEIGRIYGYEKFPSKLSISQTALPEKNQDLILIKKIRNLMKGLGFTETYNYSFISGKDAEFFSRNGKENLHLIELLNPVSSNVQYLRFSLIPNLLKAVKLNQKRFDNIKLFEIGNIFDKNSEKRIFGGLIVGKDKFYELKGIIRCILKELGILGDIYVPSQETMRTWELDNLALIKVKAEKLGLLGKILKETLSFYDIKRPVFAFEIDFRTLLKLSRVKREYKSIPIYPETTRDLSVIVPAEAPAGDVIKKIYSKGENLIINVEVFDVYEGSPLQKGEKNISFHIIYQAKDRTLIAKEVDKIQEKIIENLQKNSQWKVRK